MQRDRFFFVRVLHNRITPRHTDTFEKWRNCIKYVHKTMCYGHVFPRRFGRSSLKRMYVYIVQGFPPRRSYVWRGEDRFERVRKSLLNDLLGRNPLAAHPVMRYNSEKRRKNIFRFNEMIVSETSCWNFFLFNLKLSKMTVTALRDPVGEYLNFKGDIGIGRF